MRVISNRFSASDKKNYESTKRSLGIVRGNLKGGLRVIVSYGIAIAFFSYILLSSCNLRL